MKTSSKNAGLKVKTSIKAAGIPLNHNRNGLKVKTSIKAGELIFRDNHCRRFERVR